MNPSVLSSRASDSTIPANTRNADGNATMSLLSREGSLRVSAIEWESDDRGRPFGQISRYGIRREHLLGIERFGDSE